WAISPWAVGVLVIVNGLTALNLSRVFRLIFAGEPQQKTRRAPEVGWLMALPMLILSVLTLAVPLVLDNWLLLPDWDSLNWSVISILVSSSLVGISIGSSIYLHKGWSRSIELPWRFVQDVLGYDFYIDRVYQFTVVGAIALLSKISAWCDRYIIDNAVNLVGFATIFSGQSLKYSVSGQSQGYLLTILIGISVLGFLISWSLGLLTQLPF
ncbi:MAG: NAD(P)H-quinone oxidoreductase subunit F, partial [Nostocaceae cyanobacterium]|nr:NAD(P)H-quinone oxidoreductase subunit F [Nostocaceae cyanobacterium]